MATANVQTITVTGTYLDMLNRPGWGFVYFKPSGGIFEDKVNKVIVTKMIYSAKLLADGTFSIKIPTTNVPGLTPTSFTYTIVEKVTGMEFRETSGVAIPSTLGDTVDITELI